MTDYLMFDVGQVVVHGRFGIGQVVESTPDDGSYYQRSCLVRFSHGFQTRCGWSTLQLSFMSAEQLVG
jgi:hypothetical protein